MKPILIAAILILAIPAGASDIYWNAGALETTVGNSCVPTTNSGNLMTYRTMNCNNGSLANAIAHGVVPPDAGTTYTVHIFWKTSSALTNNVCWSVQSSVCTTNSSACNYDQTLPLNSVSTTPLANGGAELLMESVLVSNATLWNEALTTSCAGTACQSKPLTLNINRIVGGGCTGGLNATVQIVGVLARF